jgi:hypothetical protein
MKLSIASRCGVFRLEARLLARTLAYQQFGSAKLANLGRKLGKDAFGLDTASSWVRSRRCSSCVASQSYGNGGLAKATRPMPHALRPGIRMIG